MQNTSHHAALAANISNYGTTSAGAYNTNSGKNFYQQYRGNFGYRHEQNQPREPGSYFSPPQIVSPGQRTMSYGSASALPRQRGWNSSAQSPLPRKSTTPVEQPHKRLLTAGVGSPHARTLGTQSVLARTSQPPQRRFFDAAPWEPRNYSSTPLQPSSSERSNLQQNAYEHTHESPRELSRRKFPETPWQRQLKEISLATAIDKTLETVQARRLLETQGYKIVPHNGQLEMQNVSNSLSTAERAMQDYSNDHSKKEEVQQGFGVNTSDSQSTNSSMEFTDSASVSDRGDHVSETPGHGSTSLETGKQSNEKGKQKKKPESGQNDGISSPETRMQQRHASRKAKQRLQSMSPSQSNSGPKEKSGTDSLKGSNERHTRPEKEGAVKEKDTSKNVATQRSSLSGLTAKATTKGSESNDEVTKLTRASTVKDVKNEKPGSTSTSKSTSRRSSTDNSDEHRRPKTLSLLETLTTSNTYHTDKTKTPANKAYKSSKTPISGQSKSSETAVNKLSKSSGKKANKPDSLLSLTVSSKSDRTPTGNARRAETKALSKDEKRRKTKNAKKPLAAHVTSIDSSRNGKRKQDRPPTPQASVVKRRKSAKPLKKSETTQSQKETSVVPKENEASASRRPSSRRQAASTASARISATSVLERQRQFDADVYGAMSGNYISEPSHSLVQLDHTQSQQIRNDKHSKQMRNVAVDSEGVPATDEEWSEDEVKRLLDACRSCSVTLPNFWAHVANCVGTRTATECNEKWRKMHNRAGNADNDNSRQSRNSGALLSKPSASEVTKGHAQLAKKGTIKRRQQLREIINEHSQQEHADDIFKNVPDSTSDIGATPRTARGRSGNSSMSTFNTSFGLDTQAARKRKRAISEDEDGADVATSLWQYNQESPGILRSIDRSDYDAFIEHSKKAQRVGSKARYNIRSSTRNDTIASNSLAKKSPDKSGTKVTGTPGKKTPKVDASMTPGGSTKINWHIEDANDDEFIEYDVDDEGNAYVVKS